MTVTKEDLKHAFSDGMLPTGDNFADLIDSTVSTDAFKDHVAAFEAWKARPKITIGTAPTDWDLTVTTADTLTVGPGQAEFAKTAADVNVWGYAGLSARIGAAANADAFADPTPTLSVENMDAVLGDGAWHTIIDHPGRPCSFEVTAMANAPATKPDKWYMKLFRAVTGWPVIGPTMLQAVAASSGGNGQPSLQVTQCPNPRAAMESLKSKAAIAALLATVAAIIYALGWDAPFVSAWDKLMEVVNALLKGLESAINAITILIEKALSKPEKSLALNLVDHKAEIALILLGYLIARGVTHATLLNRRTCHIRWRKTKSGKKKSYALQIRSAKGFRDIKAAKVSYAITRLWD
ncbi:hypothetical protein [uncultured Litoreibacter sp.]|uniref:hypothetical protein n=1 Tax=uncultured Litoreibacter sp. TaxID=1392394 RepID=UPI0026062CA7|nr:hypothetical protein [uncultured Litoreibacter sp.]